MKDIDYISPDGELKFLVRSSGVDVTLGFDGFKWHTHSDVLAAVSARQTVASFWSSHTPESADADIAKSVEQLLSDLQAGKLAVAVKRVSGFIRDVWIEDRPAHDPYCLPDETIEFRLWDGSIIPIESES